MKVNNLYKKAQSLPLNTIVIAILVVIVLLVIIVAFTDNFTGTNEQIGDAAGCSVTNPIVSVKYSEAEWYEGEQRTGYEKVTGFLSRDEDDDGINEYCYGKLK